MPASDIPESKRDRPMNAAPKEEALYGAQKPPSIRSDDGERFKQLISLLSSNSEGLLSSTEESEEDSRNVVEAQREPEDQYRCKTCDFSYENSE